MLDLKKKVSENSFGFPVENNIPNEILGKWVYLLI